MVLQPAYRFGFIHDFSNCDLRETDLNTILGFFVIFIETCACPPTIHTNYASMLPYIHRDKSGNIKGLLPYIITNMSDFACGGCKRSTNNCLTVINYSNNGKNGWAEKSTIMDVKRDIDSYVQVSFPLLGRQELTHYLGFAFVPVIKHPGVVFFIIKESLDEQVSAMMKSIFSVWPIIFINGLLIVMTGIIVWSLVSFQVLFKIALKDKIPINQIRCNHGCNPSFTKPFDTHTLYQGGVGRPPPPPPLAILKTVVPMNLKFCRVLETSFNVLEMFRLFT